MGHDRTVHDPPRVTAGPISAAEIAAAPRPEGGLEPCPACDGCLRHLRSRQPAGRPSQWLVTLSCPDCGLDEVLRVHLSRVAELDAADAAAEAELATALLRLRERRGREDVDLLVACLRTDAILPEDF